MPQTINLESLAKGFEGKPFYQLIEHHLNRQSQRKRMQGVLGTIDLLPSNAKPLVEMYIDKWNSKAYSKDFWVKDASVVFSEINAETKLLFENSGIEYNDDDVFNMFNIIVLNFAYTAYDQPKMKKFIGISTDKFPFASAISLAYPIAATYYISRFPATALMIMGYGITNLSYIMFVAGIIKGTFLIFKLRKRLHVLLFATVCFIIGMILSNIGN